MHIYWISISMAIVANVVYHLSAKQVPSGPHPLATLTITYGVAALSCLILLFGLRVDVPTELSRSPNWASVILGLSIVLLEMGFILAYRVGWNVSVAALFANVAVGIILLPIGLFIFRERLSPANLLGVTLALVGLYLIGRKPG